MLTLAKKDLPAYDTDQAMRGLLQRLHLRQDGHKLQTVTFLSARKGEGVSTIANQYVQMLAAETSKKVLLIDAGAYNKKRFDALSIHIAKGLMDTALSGSNISDAIYSINGNCFIARWMGLNATQNQTGRVMHMEGFWQSLGERFDAIVIDAPALQVSFDGIMFAVKSDGAIIIVEAEKTPKPVVRHLRNTLIASGAQLVGVVLNKRHYYIPGKIYRKL